MAGMEVFVQRQGGEIRVEGKNLNVVQLKRLEDLAAEKGRKSQKVKKFRTK